MRLPISKIAHLVCGTLFLAASASLLSTNALADKLQIVPVKNTAEFFGQELSVVAKLRCATTKNQAENNQETWPVCGFFGLSPKATQKIYYLGPTTSKEVTTSPEALLGRYESDFVSGVSAWAAQDSTYRSVSVGEVPAPFDDRLDDALQSKRSGESGRLGAKKHPFLSFEAYIDDDALLFHSALDLFSVGSTRVKIPGGTYRSIDFPPATNLDDYNWTEESTEATDPKCGDGKRFAILAHEPHSEKVLEALLFQLLNHLQSNFKEVFGTLVVLQEGQYASPPLADAELTPPVDSSDPIDVLIKQSYGFWTEMDPGFGTRG